MLLNWTQGEINSAFMGRKWTGCLVWFKIIIIVQLLKLLYHMLCQVCFLVRTRGGQNIFLITEKKLTTMPDLVVIFSLCLTLTWVILW